jgi:hypothetical protein
MAVHDLRTGPGKGPGEGSGGRPAGAVGPAEAAAVSPRCLENLWVRLKVGDRLRPRDAESLRRLALPPFDASLVYEVDARGYVIAVGLPGETRAVDAARLLDVFEARYGIPAGPDSLRAAS